MTTLALHRDSSPESKAIILPPPRGGAISIRAAVANDIKFIDDLQRKHAKMVGWFPTKQLETNIARGQVWIAETGIKASRDQGIEGQPNLMPGCLDASMPRSPVGYCIAHDRYFKRDDCGIIYQLNVAPGKQRGLIGASLIKAVFERAAYGCKLFCCWCAQDLEANHFWESIGFVPLAFRTGSRKAGSKKEPRIHIFWQRRIREGDVETPWWFPSETTGGALRENRLVLPIPPGTHWSDAKPALLPGVQGLEGSAMLQIGSDGTVGSQSRGTRLRVKSKKPKTPAPSSNAIAIGGLRFGPPPQAKVEKIKEPKIRFKNDPKHVAAARELRDRYLEEVNAPHDRMLPAAWGGGKYDVGRQLEAAASELKQMPSPHLLSPHLLPPHLLKAA